MRKCVCGHSFFDHIRRGRCQKCDCKKYTAVENDHCSSIVTSIVLLLGLFFRASKPPRPSLLDRLEYWLEEKVGLCHVCKGDLKGDPVRHWHCTDNE